MTDKPYCITAAQLAQAGRDNIPPQLVSNTHLIYSSPAALAFNSPGAQGFGVKRAALVIPDSVMLLVAPGCCGRNTSQLSDMSKYKDRFFFLLMDQTDIVTGRHLKLIPQAVEEICEYLEKKPSVVMICITCVDALLGTDMERVCRRAQEAVNIPVLPCYMYALTREGRKPPMVHVRQSIYSPLEKRPRRSDTVNLLGYFAPLMDECELYDLLGQIGIKRINEISRCKDYEEFLDMAKAGFNLVLNPEARYAAQDMQKKLDIPQAELTRLYQIDKIKNQYAAFANALGVKFDDEIYYNQAKNAVDNFARKHPDAVFAIGETINANPFELALALLRYGFGVSEIFATVSPEYFVYIKKIAAISPETKIYSNLEPTMLYYDIGQKNVNVTLGRDAEYYHPDCPNLPWNEDVQPFGYAGLRSMFEHLDALLDKEES